MHLCLTITTKSYKIARTNKRTKKPNVYPPHSAERHDLKLQEGGDKDSWDKKKKGGKSIFGLTGTEESQQRERAIS